MAPTSPVVSIWELGLRLRECRDLVGLTATDAAQHAGCTQGYLSDVERGKTKIAPEKLDALFAAYELGKDEVAKLLGLRKEGNRRGWWQEYSGIFDATVMRYFGHEYGAASLSTYDTLVPGLLQTEEYVRALFLGTPNYPLTEMDLRVEARLTRQRRLDGEDPLRLTAVINEAVLHQQVGGPEVLRQQLRHLVDVVERHPETVELRVVPFTAGGYDALGASTFHLLDFQRDRLPQLLYQESLTISDIVNRPMVIRQFTYALREALGLALSTQDSLALVRRAEAKL